MAIKRTLEADKRALIVELSRDIDSRAVLDAMRQVPRELFVPADVRETAYRNIPLSIGFGQTISQPYMVAWMTELLELSGDESVLEVGTGSGYQAAVLSHLLPRGSLVTVERVPALADTALQRLNDLGCRNITALPAGPILGVPALSALRRYHSNCGLPRPTRQPG